VCKRVVLKIKKIKKWKKKYQNTLKNEKSGNK
jgi:hypothetical protein